MEKHFEVTFDHSAEDVRDVIKINGKGFLFPDIVPDENYYRYCESFFKDCLNTHGGASALEVSEKIVGTNKDERDLAMLAFTIGHCMAVNGNQHRMMIAADLIRKSEIKASKYLERVYIDCRRAGVNSVISGVLTIIIQSGLLVVIDEMQNMGIGIGGNDFH